MLKENKKNYGKNQKGSTAVEFALIAIIFITVLFAIMEAGRIFWTQNTLQYAIEVASRELLVDNSLSEAEVEAIAAQKIEEFFISSAPFSADVVLTTESDVDFVQIDATYSYTAMINALLPESWSSFELTARVRRPLIWND